MEPPSPPNPTPGKGLSPTCAKPLKPGNMLPMLPPIPGKPP
ncbi:hypothetical protein KSS87_011432, partial [Heliosperma pusillum]